MKDGMMVRALSRAFQCRLVQSLLFGVEWPEYGTTGGSADKVGHLYDKDSGEMYMGRWSIIDKGSRASKVLGFLTRGEYDHVRLHWIRRSDGDRELHDHPFNYRTFVLEGWYDEVFIPHKVLNAQMMRTWQGSSRKMEREVLMGTERSRMMRAGSTARAEEGQFHRIAEVSDGGVWTLFCMGKDTGKWGFLVDGRWLKSSKFFQLRGIGADGLAA